MNESFRGAGVFPRVRSRERTETVVVAIDPGKRTGISWATIERWTRAAVVSSWNEGTGGTCEVTGPTEPHRQWAILSKIMELSPDVVVLEDFRLYPDRDHRPDLSGTEPMRHIAVLDFFWVAAEAGFFDHEPFKMPLLVKQMAGERYDITVDELKRLKLYRTKGQGGGKDSTAATQHLLHYIKKVNESRRT